VQRLPDQRYAETINEALSRFPAGMARRLDHVQFLCGVSPVFAGLHTYTGRHYAATAHCVYPSHISRYRAERVTTIVLPTPQPAHVVFHELAHALHLVAGLDHHADATTAYATADRYEAFAEALTTWRHHGYGDEAALYADGKTCALFAALAAP